MSLIRKYRIKTAFKLLFVIICLGLSMLLAACNLFWRDEGLKVAQAFPVYPNATYMSRSDSSWPDAKPSITLAYTAEASVQDLVEFYTTQPTLQDWQLSEVIQHDDPAATIKVLWENEDWNCRVLIDNQDPRRIEIEISPK